MANEVKTTKTTLVGLMERAQADAVALFQLTSRLAPFCVQKEATSAEVIQFPIYGPPSPVSEHSVEADDPTKVAVSIGQRLLTPSVFPKITRFSKLSQYSGKNIPRDVLQVLVNDVTAGVDKHIASQAAAANFTETPIDDCVTLAAFSEGITALRNTGYQGQVRCFLTEYMALKIQQDMRNYNLPQTNEFTTINGYLGRLLGAEIVTIPSSWAPTVDGKKAGLIWYHGFGLAWGYHGSLVQMTNVEDHLASELGAATYGKASHLAATGGILLLSDSASL